MGALAGTLITFKTLIAGGAGYIRDGGCGGSGWDVDYLQNLDSGGGTKRSEQSDPKHCLKGCPAKPEASVGFNSQRRLFGGSPQKKLSGLFGSPV